jgi:hypothetical protein
MNDIAGRDALYAIDIVRKICEEAGPGLPGSSEERERADIIKRELESHLSAGNVSSEEFTLAPRAFLGSLTVCGILLLFAALLNISIDRIPGIPPWLNAALALILSAAAALVFVFEYFLYREFIDPLFGKKRSVNVIGTLRQPGTRDAKRLLMISGHHDSAWENPMIRLLRYGFYITLPTVLLAIIAVSVLSALQLAGAVTAEVGLVRSGTLGWVLAAYPVVPAVVFAVFFTRRGRGGGTVPGAVDNLSACALAVAMCRFLKENPEYVPEDTEIRFISFGSEEAGLRGSRRYVERHKDELRRLDARVLNFEMIACPEIAILTNDVNGTVKNAPEMVKSVAAAAKRAGVPYKVKAYPAGGGGSDAGPFAQAGIRALTLLPFKVPQQIIAFFHQREDGPQNLAAEPFVNALKLALEWIRSGGE